MRIRWKKDKCALYKWLYLVIFCALFFGLCAGPAYGEEPRKEDLVTYPTRPIESHSISPWDDPIRTFVKTATTQIRTAAAQLKAYHQQPEPSMEYVGTWTISFYCPCELCCGEWATGCTASGVLATEWHTVATDQFPFGTQLYIDGLGYFVVEDTGVSGEWLDVFVSDHQEALNLGLQYRDVYIVY